MLRLLASAVCVPSQMYDMHKVSLPQMPGHELQVGHRNFALHSIAGDRPRCADLRLRAFKPKKLELLCDICSLTKPENIFSVSALKNRAAKTQVTRCHDCSHPPCIFLPSCTTCAKCRNPTCRTKICSKAIEPLPSMELPASAEKVQTFECKRCKYVRCIVVQPDGTRCGRERRHNAQAQAKRLHNDYKCGAGLR